MMQNDELPLVDAIDDARFQESLDEHEVDFGGDGDAVSEGVHHCAAGGGGDTHMYGGMVG